MLHPDRPKTKRQKPKSKNENDPLSGFAGTETRGVEFFVWGKERKIKKYNEKKNKHQEEKLNMTSKQILLITAPKNFGNIDCL